MINSGLFTKAWTASQMGVRKELRRGDATLMGFQPVQTPPRGTRRCRAALESILPSTAASHPPHICQGPGRSREGAFISFWAKAAELQLPNSYKSASRQTHPEAMLVPSLRSAVSHVVDETSQKHLGLHRC